VQNDINGLQQRVAAIENKVAIISATDTTKIDTELASLKTELSKLKTDIDGIKDDIEDISSDTNSSKSELASLTNRITKLEQPPATTTPPATTPSVPVSVTIGSAYSPMFNAYDPYTFMVNIQNNTTTYQYISFFVNVNAVSPTTRLIDNTTKLISPAPSITFEPTFVPALSTATTPPSGTVSQILFLPQGRLLVPPGLTSMYLILTIKPSDQSVWSVGVSNVTNSPT